MKKYLKYFDLGATVLALVAVISFLFPAIVIEGMKITGFEAVFGYSASVLEVLSFSVFNFITLIAAVAAAAFFIASYLTDKKSLLLTASSSALISGVLFFLMKTFASFATTANYFTDNATLGFGAIIGGVCLLVAAVLGFIKDLLDK